VKARQEAGGRRQEKNNYGIKTGFSIRLNSRIIRVLKKDENISPLVWFDR